MTIYSHANYRIILNETCELYYRDSLLFTTTNPIECLDYINWRLED